MEHFFFIFKITNYMCAHIYVYYLPQNNDHQWLSGSALKTGRWEVRGSNIGNFELSSVNMHDYTYLLQHD